MLSAVAEVGSRWVIMVWSPSGDLFPESSSMSTNRLPRVMDYYHFKLHRDVVLGDMDQLLDAIARASREAVAAGPLDAPPDRSGPGCAHLHCVASFVRGAIEDQAELVKALEAMSRHTVIVERDKTIATSIRTN